MARAAEFPTGVEGEITTPSISPLGLAWQRLVKKRIAMLALGFIILFYTAGLTAPLLTEVDILHSYTDQNLEEALQGPSWSHPFGTDRLGRDQFSRVVWAAQTTMIVTVATLVTGGIVLAVGLGLISGYLGLLAHHAWTSRETTTSAKGFLTANRSPGWDGHCAVLLRHLCQHEQLCGARGKELGRGAHSGWV